MARALITGGAGFIGSHLAKVLRQRGDDVTCLVRRTSSLERLESLGVKIAYGDVTDAASLKPALADQDVVYHLAACAHALRDCDYYRVNVEGTRNVAECCAAQPRPPVLVVVSSLAASGPSADGTPYGDCYPARPVSHYGRSKQQGEREAAAYADRVPTTIVRVAAVFGEGDHRCFEMFRPIHRLGIHATPVRPLLRVSMIHVADVVQLLVLAADKGKRLVPGSDATSGYYYASTHETPDYRQWGQMIAETVGRRRVFSLPLPGWLLKTIGLINDGVSRFTRKPSLLTYDKTCEATAGGWVCHPVTAARELGFVEGASLRDRLRQTALWYRQQRWL